MNNFYYVSTYLQKSKDFHTSDLIIIYFHLGSFIHPNQQVPMN